MRFTGADEVPYLARDAVHVHSKADAAIADKGQPKFFFAHNADVAGRVMRGKGVDPDPNCFESKFRDVRVLIVRYRAASQNKGTRYGL